MPGRGPESDEGILEKTRQKVAKPPLYRVVLHNDDYTTMDFVIRVLESVFQKRPAEAYRIMMKVHTEGCGNCGSYTFEVAETKVSLVHDLARAEGFPLRASVEEA
jgi:ATP-dependent Clp protease adaptor protein ClpS